MLLLYSNVETAEIILNLPPVNIMDIIKVDWSHQKDANLVGRNAESKKLRKSKINIQEIN